MDDLKTTCLKTIKALRKSEEGMIHYQRVRRNLEEMIQLHKERLRVGEGSQRQIEIDLRLTVLEAYIEMMKKHDAEYEK